MTWLISLTFCVFQRKKLKPDGDMKLEFVIPLSLEGLGCLMECLSDSCCLKFDGGIKYNYVVSYLRHVLPL